MEQQQLERAIAALESQRALLGDEVVDALAAPARARLAALRAAAPPPLAEPAQALKQVSILFLDLVGSTALSQQLDPEATSAVLDGALARASSSVQAHQGRVLQYAGDNLLAAFGADGVSESDAENAVLCGLSLLQLGRLLGAEVLAAHGHSGFGVRVGVHTGGVLLGGGVDRDGTIRGTAVHVAARMEQTAPAGGLRISHDCYIHVRGRFDVEEQPPLVAKGVAEPVRSYLVQRARPRSALNATRGIEGLATKMVGREAELGALQQAFRQLFERRRMAAVTVVADAGVGKSRLLHEFEVWRAGQPQAVTLLCGRATGQTEAQPFGLLRDILAGHLRIADDDSLEAARTKIEQAVVPLFLHDDGADIAEGHAHLLGHLIGIDWRDSRHVRGIVGDPQQIRSRALHAAAQWLRRMAVRDGALLLVLEDLHWADNQSLDFIRQLADTERDVALLLLAFSRPTLFERRPDWARAAALGRRIELRPLDETASRLLADELLRHLPEVPVALRELVVGSAEGNPFYMEERVNMLIDRGAIRTGGGASARWELDAERLQATQVPATLTGVLQARLDGLPAAERLTLQEASVIGPVFWDRTLAAVDAHALPCLSALLRRELVLPHRGAAEAAADDLREYDFKHQILHQVTYGTVLRRSRRELHAKVAAWLAAQTGLRANDFLGATAEHFARAGDDANAAEFHARAAEHARSRFVHDAVLDHVRQALALIDQAPDDEHRVLRWRLLDARERTLDLQGDRAGQQADIEAMERLATQLGDPARQAHAAYQRCVLALRRADWSACEQAGRTAQALAAQAGRDELRLLAMRLVAIALSKQGRMAEAQPLVQAALEQARTLGLRGVESFCLNALVLFASMQSDPVAVLAFSRQGLEIDRAIGNRRGEASSLSNVGCGLMDLGALAQARQDLELGLRLARANGDRVIEGATLCSLSNTALCQGDAGQALALAQSAVDTAQAAQAHDRLAIALSKLGNAALALGDHAVAAAAYQRSRDLAVTVDEPVQHDARAGLARVALGLGQVVEARAHAQALLAHEAAGGSFDGAEDLRRVELTCHQVLAASGDAQAAQRWLQRAQAQLQATAATISDARLRASYLEALPTHREILAAAGSSPPSAS